MADDTDTIDPDSHLNQPDPHSDAEFERERQKDAADAEERRRDAIKKGNPAPKEFDPYAATGAVKPAPAAAAPAGGFDPRKYGDKNPPESAVDPNDPDRWLVDPDFGGTSPWTRYPAQAARGLLRGAVYDPAYGLGQLARMGVQAMRPNFKETRPADELAARWGSPVRQMRAREHQSEPGWLTRLADYTEGEFGPKSKAAKVYGAASAGPVEATTRFAGGLALPAGAAAKSAAGLAKLAATGAAYGLTQPAEHGTFKEKLAQAGAGAIGAAGLGYAAKWLAPKVVQKVTRAMADSGISELNAKISGPEEGQAVKNAIVPQLQGMANRIRTTITGNPEAEQTLTNAMTAIDNHFANKKTLGGTEFSRLVNDLDAISSDLRLHGGKLAPQMGRVANGIDSMVAELEKHVTRNASQEVKGEQSAARARLRNFIEDEVKEAEKPPIATGTTLADAAHALVRHKFGVPTMVTGAASGLGGLAGSRGFRAIAPRLGQAAAVRATQQAEDANDSKN
jgi:hypothetical protein